jgi:PAS domain S-box-containing protein
MNYAVTVPDAQGHAHAFRVSAATAWFELALDAAEVGVWEWDLDANLVECTDVVETLLGLPQLHRAFAFEELFALTHPDDCDRVMEAIRHIIQDGGEEHATIEVRVVLSDRRVRWLELKARLFQRQDRQALRMAGTVVDITARKEAEAAHRLTEESLAASEDRLRSAMHHSPIGMAIVAPDGRWLEANPALCATLGYERDDLLRTDFQSLTHPEDLDADLGLVAQMLAHEIESYEMEKRYFHKDGRIVWVQLNVSLVWNSDRTPRHFISQIQDVTFRKLADA